MNIRSIYRLHRLSFFGLFALLLILAFGVIRPALAASTIYVNDDWVAVPIGADPDGTGPAANFGVDSFASIQPAIDLAAPGDTVLVYFGTYTEQVTIAKDISLLTTQGAVIQAFALMPPNCTSEQLPDNHPIVCIRDTGAAEVRGFTIDGLSLGDSNPYLTGIAFHNAGGTVQENVITNIRFDAVLQDKDEGAGITLFDSDGAAFTVNVLDNTITNFNKNGISLTSHESLAPVIFLVQGNTISGTPNAIVPQNGVEVQLPGGSGTINGNIISGIAFDNSNSEIPRVAASILNIYTPVQTLYNEITNTQLGIYYLDGSGRIQANSISVIKPGTSENPGGNVYGILAGDREKDTISPIDPPENGVSLMDVSLAAVQSVKVDNNLVLYTGELPNTNTYGIEVDAGFGANSMTIEIHHNRFGNAGQGFDKGIALYQCDNAVDGSCDTGLFSYLRVWSNNILGNNTGLYLGGSVPMGSLKTFIYNRIVGNLVGAENDTAIEFWVKNNWWGCNAGPNMPGCDTLLNSGSGSIIADKWLVLTVSADPTHVLQGAESTITADLRYNSTGVIPFADNVPDTVPVSFSVKTLGSVAPPSAFYTSGLAEAIFTAPAAYGAFEICAVTDNQEVCSTVTVPEPLNLSGLALQYSTDGVEWSPVGGTFADGFTMFLVPRIEWYYLNTSSLVVNNPLSDGMHPFFIESYPDGYFDYWAGRGVVDGAGGWQGIMYKIITGEWPIFYLKVDGSNTMLVDGLQYIASGGTEVNPLRINGSYLPGDYTFSGSVVDIYGYYDNVSVDITFTALDKDLFLPLIMR